MIYTCLKKQNSYVQRAAVGEYLEVCFQLSKVEDASGDINTLPDGALLGRVQLDPVQLLQFGPLPGWPLRLHVTLWSLGRPRHVEGVETELP